MNYLQKRLEREAFYELDVGSMKSDPGPEKYSEDWFFEQETDDKIILVYGSRTTGKISVFRKSGIVEVYLFAFGEMLEKKTYRRRIEYFNDSLTNYKFKLDIQEELGGAIEMRMKLLNKELDSAHMSKVSVPVELDINSDDFMRKLCKEHGHEILIWNEDKKDFLIDYENLAKASSLLMGRLVSEKRFQETINRQKEYIEDLEKAEIND